MLYLQQFHSRRAQNRTIYLNELPELCQGTQRTYHCCKYRNTFLQRGKIHRFLQIPDICHTLRICPRSIQTLETCFDGDVHPLMKLIEMNQYTQQWASALGTPGRELGQFSSKILRSMSYFDLSSRATISR